MNLRYTTIWDMPLRLLACVQLAGLLSAVCVCELRQYLILFHDAALYELVPGGLLFALKILKGATPIIQ